jgi:hypothetical protein
MSYSCIEQKKGGGAMKAPPRRKAPVALPAPLLAALLSAALFCLFPLSTSAQTRTEEEVSTGRFGAEEPEDDGAPAVKKGLDTDWLYLGLRAGPSLRFYTPAEDTRFTGGDTYAVSMDIALQANVQVLSFLSIQAEAVFTWDSVSLWAYRSGSASVADRYSKDYTSFSFCFPLMVKFDFYPGRFRISPFLGAYVLAPLGKLEASNSLNNERQSLSYKVSPPLGFLGGLGGALKFGPGAVIADLRYTADLGKQEAAKGKIDEFRRSMISVTVGYEFGFFAKKRGNP